MHGVLMPCTSSTLRPDSGPHSYTLTAPYWFHVSKNHVHFEGNIKTQVIRDYRRPELPGKHPAGMEARLARLWRVLGVGLIVD